MKRLPYSLILVGLLALFAGCQKKESDEAAIRSGINQHLASLQTLNVGAMDMSITNVSIQGSQAQAQVEFRPKGSAPGSAGMQIAYKLQKQNGLWLVQDSQAIGGAMQHPAPGENPPTNPTSPPSGSLPNFRDLVPEGGSPNSLPPGHPATNTQGNSQAQ